MIGFEENEVSKKANGGTEITKRGLAKLIPEQKLRHFQIIPSRIRDLNPEAIRVLWIHDNAEDTELSHLKEESSRQRFHKFIFNSNFQLNEFAWKLKFPLDHRVKIIETPVEPIELKEKSKDEVRLIYFSTPQRGLEMLVPVFEHMCETGKFKNVHLDVYSSFSIYGWEDPQKYKDIFGIIQAHPQMTYHGAVDQDTMREALQKAHVLAYPNIWQETACRVLIESMSAGLLCVHPNHGALADTSGMLTLNYQYDYNMQHHAHKFYNALAHAIDVVNNDEVQNQLKFVKLYADARFGQDRIAAEWENTLNELLREYDTVESRSFPEEKFRYSTS